MASQVSRTATLQSLGTLGRRNTGSPERALCGNGCGSELVFTPDAIGRLRERCPSCDGVAPIVYSPHVARPQGNHPELQPAPAPTPQLLPRIEPGQVRCQGCAHGVAPEARLCVRCELAAAESAKAERAAAREAAKAARAARGYHIPECRKCHRSFTASGPATRTCPECR